jgi:hypothetical protein
MFSHHISLNTVPDHPEGGIRLSLRDRVLQMTHAEARYLATELLKMANVLDPPPEPPVEVTVAPEEPAN